MPLLLAQMGTLYLKDGHCSLSNNWSENSINLVIVGRKNWLFSSSVARAEASTDIYTIIDMAKIHGLNRQKYLEYILEHSSDAEMTDGELALLAPWNKGVKRLAENVTIRHTVKWSHFYM